MKQVMFVSALLLIMIIAFGGSTSSKMHPDGYQDLTKPEGDDQPWGGEQWTERDPMKSSQQPRNPVITSYVLIDFFFALYLDGITTNLDGTKSKSDANSVRVTSGNRNVVISENNTQETSRQGN